MKTEEEWLRKQLKSVCDEMYLSNKANTEHGRISFVILNSFRKQIEDRLKEISS